MSEYKIPWCYSPYALKAESKRRVQLSSMPQEKKKSKLDLKEYSKFTRALAKAGITEKDIKAVVAERLSRIGNEDIRIYEDTVETIVKSYKEGLLTIQREEDSCTFSFGGGRVR